MLRSDLEKEGQDLEWTMLNPTLEDMIHKPPRQQIRLNVVFVSEKVNDNKTEFLLDTIPYCLLSCSSTFRFAFFCQLTHYVAPLNPLELEELTILSYKMSIINLHKQLWSTYLQSGTGQMKKSHPSRQPEEDGTTLYYWPAYLHSFTVARAYSKTMNDEPMDHDKHIESVQLYLSHLEEQFHDYLTQFDTIKNEMLYYTPALTYQIEQLIRKHALSSVNIYFDAITTLLKHDYADRFMQLQYLQQKPTPEQVCITLNLN